MTKWQRMEKKAGGRNLYGTRGRGSFWAGRRAAGVSTVQLTAMQQTQSLGSVTGLCHSLSNETCVNFKLFSPHLCLSVMCRCPLHRGAGETLNAAQLSCGRKPVDELKKKKKKKIHPA